MVKKPMLLQQLLKIGHADVVIIESLEQALYRLVVEIDGQSFYIMENSTKSLTRRSIVALQELLISLEINSMYLSHVSPYDEMIGHEVNTHSNKMLVPIGNYFAPADQVVH